MVEEDRHLAALVLDGLGKGPRLNLVVLQVQVVGGSIARKAACIPTLGLHLHRGFACVHVTYSFAGGMAGMGSPASPAGTMFSGDREVSPPSIRCWFSSSLMSLADIQPPCRGVA